MLKNLQDALLDKLRAAVGPANVLTGVELSPFVVEGRTPEAAVFPGSVEEVAAVVGLAAEAPLPVTPWGGGTAATVGMPAARAGLVLHEPVQPGEPQHEARARGGAPDRRGGAASPRRHGHRGLGGEADHRCDLLDRAGEDGRLGRASLDDVRRELDPRQDVGGPDSGAELLAEPVLHAR